MEELAASEAFSALGNVRRLQIFRLLVQAGPEGIAAGEIARRLDMLQNTLSSSLSVLSHAGLIQSRRQGRSIIYSAAFDQAGRLLDFLVDNCCGGAAQDCPTFNARQRVAKAGL